MASACPSAGAAPGEAMPGMFPMSCPACGSATGGAGLA